MGKVFISYSHDSKEHVQRVFEFAKRLRNTGIDAWIDQYEGFPREGWPLWMERQLQAAKRVLIVCTKPYVTRLGEHLVPGSGLGGRWEIRRIYDELYQSGRETAKFIPVVFGAENRQHVPPALSTFTSFDLNREADFQTLLCELRGELSGVPPLSVPEPARVTPPRHLHGVPRAPDLFVGRSQAMEKAKEILRLRDLDWKVEPRALAAIHGPPGMGKTALVSALARDPEIRVEFPDGVFWLPVGQQDMSMATPRMLSRWGAELQSTYLSQATTWKAAAEALRDASQGRRLLVIADDVWLTKEANQLFNLLAEGSSVLLTTRNLRVATGSIPDHRGRYELPGLDEAAALELMGAITPATVQQHRDEVAALAAALGFTPLALVVAGRLLALEGAVWGVKQLVEEIQEGSRLLDEKAPVGTVVSDLAEDTLPTVAVLLERSTNGLSPSLRARFAELGIFRPKPATFGLDEIAALWAAEDVRPDVTRLVQHGLIESVSQGRFQMHALLQKLAQHLRSEGA